MAQTERGDPAGSAGSPGDEAPPDTPGTGEAVCPQCRGTGRQQGASCENCGGTGKIVQGVGGA